MFHINRQKIHREAPSVVETIINSVRTRCVNKGKQIVRIRIVTDLFVLHYNY